MRARTLDGRRARVHRRLLPWRRKVRDVDLLDSLDSIPDIGDADGILGAILLVVVLIVAIPVLVLALAVVGELLILVALLPLFLLARIAFKKPWIVEVTVRRTVVHAEPVVGWRAAGLRARQLAKLLAAGAPLGGPAVGEAR